MSEPTTRARASALLVCAALIPGLAAAQGGSDAGGQALQRAIVIDRVPCAGAPGQSYALYLPSSYTPGRLWPILYAFDPGAQGARPVRLAVEPAERFGWIVAGSNNSRNGPMADNQAAIAALVADTQSRFPIDPRRVYTTGFSGGARVASALALACQGCVAGVFAQGAGLPATVARDRPALGFAWFAAAGERDMNYAELVQLEQELQKRDAKQRLHIFQGGHEWAPAAVWTEALEWLELLAMNEGRRRRDDAFVASLFEHGSARAAAASGRGDVLEEQRELRALVRDFDGLADTAPARRLLEALLASRAYRKALDRERATIEEQASIASDLEQELALLVQAASESHADTLVRASRDASGLRQGLASAKQPDRRLVYERALMQVYIEAIEGGRGALREGRTESALELYAIAATLRPDAPAPHLARAQAQARAGRKQEVVRSLRRALELGTTREELARLVETGDAYAKLRDDPEIRALLTPPGPPRPPE